MPKGSLCGKRRIGPEGALETLHVGEVEQNLRFQGQYFDAETGLHYNTFRYHDPEVGRFVTEGWVVADNFILSISDDYPESYWLKTNIRPGEESKVFTEGVEINDVVKIIFGCNGRVSAAQFLNYDFLYSDGPNLVSPKLYKLMSEENVSGVQFFEAEVMLAGEIYLGYKIFNVMARSSVFDQEKSVSEPLLSYLPEGPKWYSKVVLKKDATLRYDIVRASEQPATVVVNERVKSLFERQGVRGVKFL